jgi:tetratricopeptide (TPR) repeat protein
VSRGGPEARKNLETLASGIDAFKGEDRNRLLDGLADAFARSGDRKRAVQLWTRLAEARPDDARVATLLLDLALETEPADGPAVKQAIERLRRVEGPDGALWRYAEAARIVIRARAGDKGDLGRARELLAEVAARRPEWSRVPLMTAEIAEIAGEPEVAAESYLQAIDHGERQPVVVRRAVKHLNALRRFSDADRVLRKLTDETEPAGILAQLVADNSLRRGDQSRALEMARRAVPAESKDYRDQIWLGRVSWATGRKDEAGQAMARAVELAPEAPEAWVARVEYLVRTGAKTEAEDAIRQAATKLPADRVPITMATCFEIVGQLEKAEEQYKIALSASPRNAAALRAVVDFYLRRGQNEKAAPYLGMILDPATKADPATIRWTRRKIALGEATSGNFLDVKKALAEVDRNIQETGAVEDLRVRALLMAKLPGGRREAIRAFEELGRSQSPTPDEKFLLGYLLLEDHDWPKARKMLLSALVANGENVVYLSTFIRGALAQGSVEEAGPWLEKLERLLPKNGQTIELKARAFAKQGRPDEAVKILDDYARTKDAPIGVIAALLEELGQIDAAEARYRDFVARSTQPEAVLALAEFLARRDKLSEALDLWEKAWEKADPVTVSHSGVIMLYSARMPGPDAYRRLGDRIEKAARANRGAVSFQFDLANVWSHQGRYRETEALYRRIAEMSRSSEGPLNNLAWLLAAAEGKGQEALSLVNRAMEMGGPRAEYLDTRGVVYLSLNRPQDAIADLERSIATMPTPDAYLHLAQARLTTHEATAARDALAKAKDAGLKVETLHPVERKAYEKTLAALGPG